MNRKNQFEKLIASLGLECYPSEYLEGTIWVECMGKKIGYLSLGCLKVLDISDSRNNPAMLEILATVRQEWEKMLQSSLVDS